MKMQEPKSKFDLEVNIQSKQMLYVLLAIVGGTYLVVMASSIYWGEWKIVTAFFISGLFLLVPFFLLRAGHIGIGGFLLVVIALANVTYLATLGQGIHDIAIAAYPTMIIFASLALNRQGFRVILVLILVSVIWLVFGESSGIFVSKSIQYPNLFDFVIISSILGATTLVVNLLTKNIQKNLILAKKEIDQRRQVESELREKEVQYHNLADAGIALIWTSGPDRRFTYFNLPWLAFTGCSLEQELGDGWTEGVHPDDYERCIRTYITAFDNREVFEMEYRLRNKNGEYRWIQDLGTPNFNSNKEFVGYIGYCFDVTERKHVEEQLRFQSTHDVLTGIYNRTFFEEG